MGRKYQYAKGEQPEKKKGTLIKTTVLLLVILVFVGVLSFFGIGTMRSATRMGCVENADRNSWSANYLYLDVKDEDGNVIFHQENMETGIYEVKASGKCVVRVTAKEHKGSFYIGD